jgi:hypothetical protein
MKQQVQDIIKRQFRQCRDSDREDEMGTTYSTHEGEECIGFWWKIQKEKTTRKT